MRKRIKTYKYVTRNTVVAGFSLRKYRVQSV